MMSDVFSPWEGEQGAAAATPARDLVGFVFIILRRGLGCLRLSVVPKKDAHNPPNDSRDPD